MSDYAGVTPIPDFLNISDWYELVAGDSIPQEWSVLALYQSGQVKYHTFRGGWTFVQVRSALSRGARLFTRTPTPSAIKRIRAAETQQEELPQPEQLELGWINRTEKTLRILRQDLNHAISVHEANLKSLEDKLDRAVTTLNNYIDGA